MAAGLPVIASPVGVNRSMVGTHGYLARSEEEWYQAVKAFDNDWKMLRDFGMAGRSSCEKNYDLRIWAGVLIHLLDAIVEMQ